MNDDLLALLETHSLLFHSDYHGLDHWRRVERNGLYLCEFNYAHKGVVSHFAYFHDSMRENEWEDPEHGPRAAAFLKQHREKIALDDDAFKLLCRACSGHTHGHKAADETIMTCWDADRLDLGRVGIQPDSKYLFNDEAKRIADKNDFERLASFCNS